MIVKTCINCKHYDRILKDPDSDDHIHIHDYCSLFKADIPNKVIFDKLQCIDGYNDIECGIAGCWAFSATKGQKRAVFPDIEDNPREE